jgi:spectinomycin phosphotransferase
MRDPTAEAVTAAVRRHFALDANSLVTVPGGEDAAARVYRLDSDDTRYLVKAREAADSRDVGAAVASHLHESGLKHVVAPFRSTSGSLTVEAGELWLTVLPFVDGRTGAEAGLEERHWRELGELARRLHATVLSPNLAAQVPTESYRPPELELVRRVDEAVAVGGTGQAAELWTARRSEILALTDRTEALGPQVEALALPLVLCHADLHTWNVLIDAAGELWVVDWDEVVFAPKERDLMFVVGGIGAGLVEPHETALFFEGYGETAVNEVALSYYRHAWAVQDVGLYGEQVFLAASLGDDERAHAARILMGLFEPGGIVELTR